MRPLFKLGSFLLGFTLLAFIFGYIAFLVHVSRLRPPDTLPEVDGIVVLTGADGNRLSVGAKLFKTGKAEKLLISGVNPDVTPRKIESLLGLGQQTFNCCVDLDYVAKNTRENARETAVWVQALDYESLVLVTSAYHMPRAQTELKAVLGRTRIIPWPIRPTPDTHRPWWGGRDYVREYGKLLVSFARNPGKRATQTQIQ